MPTPLGWSSAAVSIRSSRHCRVRTHSSISAMFSHDPCFGVWWTSSFSAIRQASLGLKGLVEAVAIVWVFRWSITSTCTGAYGRMS